MIRKHIIFVKEKNIQAIKSIFTQLVRLLYSTVINFLAYLLYCTNSLFYYISQK